MYDLSFCLVLLLSLKVFIWPLTPLNTLYEKHKLQQTTLFIHIFIENNKKSNDNSCKFLPSVKEICHYHKSL